MGVLDRYAEMDRAVAAQDGRPPAEIVAPTDVHRQVVELLDEMLGMIPSATGPAGTLLRTLRAAEPLLLADFAKVPAEALVEFLHGLGDRFKSIGAPGERPVADQSQSA